MSSADTNSTDDAQQKNEQSLTREHAEALVDGIDERFIHVVEIGDEFSNLHKFGLLESNEMVYQQDAWNEFDVNQIKEPLNEEEVAAEIESLIEGVVEDYKTHGGAELPVTVEYRPADSLQSANLEGIDGIDFEGESA